MAEVERFELKPLRNSGFQLYPQADGDYCLYSDYEQVVNEREKLREEQLSAIASEHFSALPVAPKPSPSIVCAEGDHHLCLLTGCTCECHKESHRGEGRDS